MRRLIVNADDLGFTAGINRGILEAHEGGIVTSTSLMVDRPGAEEGAEIARRTPSLSVGLHAVLDHNDELIVTAVMCDAELGRQLDRYQQLVGGRPTHIDSHHHTHRDPRIHDVFVAFADRQALPMREHSVRHEAGYYGEHAIGVDSLLEILGGLEEGDTELGCHPGYVEALESRYSAPREREIESLTDPRVRERLGELGIELIGWKEIA
ncbi:MAG: ChbG/HpnK family deacetylase [Acidimicrobiia bacterium]